MNSVLTSRTWQRTAMLAALVLSGVIGGQQTASAQGVDCPECMSGSGGGFWNRYVSCWRPRNYFGFARVGCNRRWARPHDPFYADPRDSYVASSARYGVPVSVPLAPVVRYQYNYGWGVPSSRLSPIGARYNQFHPEHWTTQAGNMGANAHMHPPVIYTPTDTTQLGYYHVYAPRWVPAPRSNYENLSTMYPGANVHGYYPNSAGVAGTPTPAVQVKPVRSGVTVPEPIAPAN